MSKILITGASGVLGQALMRAYTNTEHKIHAVVRDGCRIQYTPNVQPIYVDLSSNLERTWGILPENEYDIIYHFAGYGQPAKFLAEANNTMLLNSRTLISLVPYLRKGGKFVYASTSEVYSGLETLPKESSNLVFSANSNRNSYIYSKLFGEQYLQTCKDIEAYSCRICLAYGPGFKRDDERVLMQFIRRACDEKEIRMFDGGKAMRRYIYVDDAVRMIMNLQKAAPGIYNVGGTEDVSIYGLAQEVAKLTNTVVIPGDNKPLSGSPSFAGVDISKYEATWGPLENKVSLTEGLTRCIQYYQNYLL